MENKEHDLWRDILEKAENVIASAADETKSPAACLALRHGLTQYRTTGPFNRSVGRLAGEVVERLYDVLDIHGDDPPFVCAIEAELPNIRAIIEDTA